MRNEELGMRNEDAKTVVRKRRGRKRTELKPESEFTPTGRPRKKKEAPNGETRFVWNAEAEELACEKCGKLILWNFGFRKCPYCRARVTGIEARMARTRPQGSRIEQMRLMLR